MLRKMESSSADFTTSEPGSVQMSAESDNDTDSVIDNIVSKTLKPGNSIKGRRLESSVKRRPKTPQLSTGGPQKSRNDNSRTTPKVKRNSTQQNSQKYLSATPKSMAHQPNISSLTPKRIPGLTSGNQSTNIKEITKLVDV